MNLQDTASLVAIGLMAGAVWVPHCAVMCGPLAVYACSSPRGGRALLGSGLQYQLGRTLGYSMLGAAAGQLGSFVLAMFVGPWPSAILSWAVAAAMLLAALAWWRRARRSAAAEARAHVPLGRIKRGRRRAPPLAVGALSALLPCGALLTGVIAATGAGTPLGGAVVMLSFSLATAPALVLALWASRRVRSLRPGRGALAMAALFFVGALLFVYRPIPGLVDPGAACCGEAPGAM